MADIKRSTLFGKLNPIGYKSIEAATIFCKLRGNPYVETVHWFHQLLQQQDSDVLRIVKHFGLDASRLAADLIAALDRLPRGATAVSDFSPHIETALQQSYLFSTLLFGEYQVRTGHLIIAFLKTDSLKNVFLALSREFTKLKLEQLTDDYNKIVAGSPEDAMHASDGTGLAGGAEPGEASGAIPPAEMGKQEALWLALPAEIDNWWRARSRMSIVNDNGSWRIVGEGAERAVLGFAEAVDGQLICKPATVSQGELLISQAR